jgi:hypothetical protein
MLSNFCKVSNWNAAFKAVSCFAVSSSYMWCHEKQETSVWYHFLLYFVMYIRSYKFCVVYANM